jgi:hypothetical protein
MIWITHAASANCILSRRGHFGAAVQFGRRLIGYRNWHGCNEQSYRKKQPENKPNHRPRHGLNVISVRDFFKDAVLGEQCAATARTGAGRATETMIASHDRAIFDLRWIDIPK